MKCYVVLFLVCLFIMPATRAVGKGPFPKKVHRILFLGNSITYDGKYIVDIEAYFTTRYPQKKYEFINVGLPSETVSGLSEPNHADGKFARPDLHERLARVLALTKPDLVFACYGMNDGIYLPFEEERFRKFREGILWMNQEVVRSGVPIIHLTPPIFDEQNGGHKGYAAVLDRYSEWLLQQRDSLHWKVADLHFPMKKFLEERRQTEPSFAFAKDGIHPDSLGHWIMARQLLLFLGEKKVKDAESINTVLSGHPHGAEILRLIGEKQQLMKDAWLTAAKHTRPGMNVGMPLEQARLKESELGEEIRVLTGRPGM
jgi:lysophospholipase L1-like esterase